MVHIQIFVVEIPEVVYWILGLCRFLQLILYWFENLLFYFLLEIIPLILISWHWKQFVFEQSFKLLQLDIKNIIHFQKKLVIDFPQPVFSHYNKLRILSNCICSPQRSKWNLWVLFQSFLCVDSNQEGFIFSIKKLGSIQAWFFCMGCYSIFVKFEFWNGHTVILSLLVGHAELETLGPRRSPWKKSSLYS